MKNQTKIYRASWRAYQVHAKQSLKRMNKAIFDKDRAAFRRASHECDAASRYYFGAYDASSASAVRTDIFAL